MPSMYGEREIDLVLNENTSAELRTLHAGYSDILQMIGVTAREFDQCGLKSEAQAERERRALLDAQYALAMRKRAAEAG